MRCWLANPDFAPFLERAADVKPDATSTSVPSGKVVPSLKQDAERGLDKAGIKLIGPGDVTDDPPTSRYGDAATGKDHRAQVPPTIRVEEESLCSSFREGE